MPMSRHHGCTSPEPVDRSAAESPQKGAGVPIASHSCRQVKEALHGGRGSPAQ